MASAANIPKNHHFVAQMHMARFADAKGKLWAFNKSGGKLFYTATPAVFVETHLYTVESVDGVKDTSLETAFSKLEGDANGIIEKIVSATRVCDPIPLTPKIKSSETSTSTCSGSGCPTSMLR